MLNAYSLTPHLAVHAALAALGWATGRRRELFLVLCGIGATLLVLLALIFLINPMLLMWLVVIPWPTTPQVSFGILMVSYLCSFGVPAIAAEISRPRASNGP